MQEHREQAFRPLFLLLLVFFFLLLLASVPAEFVRSSGLKPLKLFNDLRPDPRYHTRKTAISGGLPLASEKGQVKISDQLVATSDSAFFSFSPLQHSLKDFFSALKSKKKVRIAYFGDSMIEGDLITQTIRELYQRKYGGAGVGLVPLTSPVAGFRQSIVHSFSNNWRENNILVHSSGGREPGIMGHVYFPPSISDTGMATSSSATYLPGRGFGNSCFHRAGVLLKATTALQWTSFRSGRQPLKKVHPGQPGRLQLLTFDVGAERAPVEFHFGGGEFPVYGINFDSDTGVYVDNLAFRGNSGMPMTRIPSSLLSATDSLLGYDLVILHYGINAVSAEVKDYSWYTKGLLRTLLHFRKAMPGTSVLLVGTADKGYNSEEGYITDPGVPRVAEAQKAAAKMAQTAFVDLFTLMGGEGTMVRWVESPAPLANKDYTHFNFSGAARIGRLIFDCLEREKELFHKDINNNL
jgi:lysophospholipase L1-like esterase